jgi:hypothetical protein
VTIRLYPPGTGEEVIVTPFKIVTTLRTTAIVSALLFSTAWAQSFQEGVEAINEGDYTAAVYSSQGGPRFQMRGCGAFLGQFSRCNAEILTILDGASSAQGHLHA